MYSVCCPRNIVKGNAEEGTPPDTLGNTYKIKSVLTPGAKSALKDAQSSSTEVTEIFIGKDW